MNLAPEIFAMALRALAEDYDQINHDLFGGVLRRPALRLSDSQRQLGLWEPDPPTITLARQQLVEQSWGHVVEVLKHEMAHQFISQILGSQEAPHGPQFRRICAERGIDSRAAGVVTLDSTADSGVLNKITRLLALAESANQHEAEAAMSAAQRLILKHNLSVLNSEQRDFRFAHLGKPTGRVAESQRTLAAILNEFFFVEVLWVDVWQVPQAKRGQVLEICGTPENIELAEYVHAFLNQAADRLWRQHQQKHGIVGNKDRRRFAAGVMTGFYRKLKREHRQQNEQGLVWVGDPELSQHFKRRYPRIRRVTYGTSAASGAHADGRRAGASLVLHKGVSSGSAGGSPKLLSS